SLSGFTSPRELRAGEPACRSGTGGWTRRGEVNSRMPYTATPTTTRAASATGDTTRPARRADRGALMRVSTRAVKPARGAGPTISRAIPSMAMSMRSRSSGHMVIAALTELLPDQPPRLGHAPLDGAHRRVQHHAHLLIRMLARARQQQRVAQLRAQSPDRLPDRHPELIARREFFRRRILGRDSVERRLVTFVVVHCGEHSPPETRQAPAPVDGLVPGDGQQPC